MSSRAHDSVSYHSLAGLLAQLRKQGVDADDFCARLRIAPEPPEDPDTRVAIDLMARAWGLAYEMTDDPALALRVGAGDTISDLGLLGHLAAHADTVDQALRAVCRYFILLSGGMSLSVADEGNGAALVAESAGTPGGAWRRIVERTFAAAVSILSRETSGRGLPRRADFSSSAPPYLGELRKLICGTCRFDAGRDALSFGPATLALRLDHRHPRLHSLFATEASHTSDSLHDGRQLSDRLKAAIPELMGRGLCNARAAARSLGVSERTLYRRLAEEGTSFHRTLDEVRKDGCLKLLSERRLSIEEIAFACGFSEPSGFFRAFRRWTGKPPSAYRANRVIG